MGITTNPPPAGSNAAANEAAYGDPYSRPATQGSNQAIVDTARAVTESLNQSAQHSGSNVRFTVTDGINPTVTKSEINPSNIQSNPSQASMGGGSQSPPVNPTPSQNAIQGHTKPVYPNESGLPPDVRPVPILSPLGFERPQGTFSAASSQTPFQNLMQNVGLIEPRAYGRVGLNNPERATPSNLLSEGFARGELLLLGVDVGVMKLASSGYNLVTNPSGTIAKGAGSIYELGAHPINSFNAFSEQLIGNPEVTIAAAGTQTAVISGGLNLGIPLAKDFYVAVGSKFIPPEKVFSPQVLSGGQTFPTAKNIPEVLQRFQATRSSEGNLMVVTTSPASLKGGVIGMGEKGGLPVPFEDAGLYVSPKGEASPAFLHLDQTGGEYSLNPLAVFKQGIPTVTTFPVDSVQLMPRGIVGQAGFTAVKDFLTAQGEAQSGVAFVTKRSEIGLGNIERQQFVAIKDFTSPFARTVVREGSPIKTTDIKMGDFITEAGTSEIEAVIPPRTKFGSYAETFLGKIKGFDYYTEYAGRKVAVRTGILNGVEDSGSGVAGVPSSKMTNIPLSKLQEGAGSFSSDVASPSKSLIPVFDIGGGFSGGSSKPDFSFPFSSFSGEGSSERSSGGSSLSNLGGGSSPLSNPSSPTNFFSGLSGGGSSGGSNGGGSSPAGNSTPSSGGSSILSTSPQPISFMQYSWPFQSYEKSYEEKGGRKTKARKDLMVFPLSSPQDIAITSMFAKQATSPGRNKLKEFKLSRARGSDAFPTYQQRTEKGKSFTKGFLKRGFI